jgi:DNA-binding transcriptional ArsR family regulator
MTTSEPDIATLAMLIANRTRARMLMTLMSRKALPASVLARTAGVTPQTASAHLQKLAAAGLVTVRPQGRLRYYALAGPAAASAIEHLATLAPRNPVRSFRASWKTRALIQARTCYGHLAGRLGVALAAGLVDHGWLAEEGGAWVLTPDGEVPLVQLGIDIQGLSRAPRPLVRQCLDWSERRPHLAGALGARLATLMWDRAWLTRITGTRAVRPTPAAAGEFSRAFGWDVFAAAQSVDKGLSCARESSFKTRAGWTDRP